jgi:hypothetical protein
MLSVKRAVNLTTHRDILARAPLRSLLQRCCIGTVVNNAILIVHQSLFGLSSDSLPDPFVIDDNHDGGGSYEDRE